MPLGTEVEFGQGHIVLHGDPAPPPRKGAQQSPPTFQPCLLWSSGRPSQQLLIFCSLVFYCNYVAISYCFKILSYIYQNLKGSRYPDHAPFKDSLLSISQYLPWSTCVPSLKCLALPFQIYERGPKIYQNGELGCIWVSQGHRQCHHSIGHIIMISCQSSGIATICLAHTVAEQQCDICQKVAKIFLPNVQSSASIPVVVQPTLIKYGDDIGNNE